MGDEFDDADLPDPSLKNILEQETLQWVFVGGKGKQEATMEKRIVVVVVASVESCGAHAGTLTCVLCTYFYYSRTRWCW